MGLYNVVLTNPKTFLEKHTLTVVEMQQIPDLEKKDAKEEISCLNWTINDGRQKVCVNFKTDTENINLFVYHYRIDWHLTDNENDLKITENRTVLAKRVFLLNYFDVLFKRFIVLDETNVHKKNKLRQNLTFSFKLALSNCIRD